MERRRRRRELLVCVSRARSARESRSVSMMVEDGSDRRSWRCVKTDVKRTSRSLRGVSIPAGTLVFSVSRFVSELVCKLIGRAG